MNASRRMTVGRDRIVERIGPSALIDGAEWLDTAQDREGVSLLARRQWLQTWAESFSGWEPWLLTWVHDDHVRAVAPLARRRAWWGWQVVFAGDTDLAEAPVAAYDDTALAGLANGLVTALAALRFPWALRLRQLPVGSALTAALVEQLPTAALSAGGRRPEMRFTDDRPPKRWLTRNTLSALAKAHNRIRREGHRLDIEWVQPWSAIKDMLPELVTVHRDRDLQLRGATLLDEADETRFYHGVIEGHAARWRLLAVRIDHSLAAYALCLQDGSVLRVWDNRVAPQWLRYSAGLIANAEVVMRAATDASVDAVDWGCGVQRYKSSMSNDVVESHNLEAWSSTVVRASIGCRHKLAGAPSGAIRRVGRSLHVNR